MLKKLLTEVQTTTSLKASHYNSPHMPETGYRPQLPGKTRAAGVLLMYENFLFLLPAYRAVVVHPKCALPSHWLARSLLHGIAQPCRDSKPPRSLIDSSVPCSRFKEAYEDNTARARAHDSSDEESDDGEESLSSIMVCCKKLILCNTFCGGVQEARTKISRIESHASTFSLWYCGK